MSIELPAAWLARINGSIARNDADVGATVRGTLIRNAAGCFCNDARSAEIDAEGPLWTLPAGAIRLSSGVGYRMNELRSESRDLDDGSSAVTAGSRHSYYAFGEVNLPLVAAEQGVPGIVKLSLNAAVRHEDYSDFGKVTTPKAGVIWSPTADVDLRATWGKSFKAPTLLQEFTPITVFLFPASLLGASGVPDDTTALLIDGGNPELNPERARTFSISTVFHPRAVTGLNLEIGYFRVEYTGRVQQPIANLLAAFSDPAYASAIAYAPTQAQQPAAIDKASPGNFLNYSGLTYDPGNVLAVVNSVYLNVTRQNVDGFDLSLDYSVDLQGGTLTFTSHGSWLDGWQRNTSTSAPFDIAGTVFHPPHFRGRAGLIWNRRALTLATYVDHIGGVDDTRSVPNPRGASQTTADAVIAYRTGEAALLGDIELNLSVKNVFNRRPAYLAPIPTVYPNYDSTNYSPIGRFLNISATKYW